MSALSRRAVVAVEAVLDIAYHAGGQPVQSREITQRQGIGPRALEPVLQNLVKAGVLLAERGKRGGYRLARERRRISVGEVVRAMAERSKKLKAIEAGSPLGAQVVRPLLEGIDRELAERLDRLTFEELCQRARAAGVESLAAERLDYAI
ncbi:MAG: Rrf2 family transcriptional regulator [Alphaproteobacteria bacterium]|nr:Rrf2 family transcriptional regulator [Alphaproteobacteria bacterium]